LPLPARIEVRRSVRGSKLCVVTTPLPAVCVMSRSSASRVFAVHLGAAAQWQKCHGCRAKFDIL
jgi:hypothetical protein